MMADTYFDVQEVSEYGEYFYNESQKLEGLSEIFVIRELRTILRTALDAFYHERGAAAGSLDGVRKEAKLATEESREVLGRFFSFLNSLKAGSVDKDAFFKSGKLGDLSRVKPAEVQTRLETVLLGFEANQQFKDRDDWKKELTTSLSTLKLSLDTKHSKRADTARSTALKSVAYAHFLVVYNQVAKSAVAGLLAQLSRASEYPLFFKDLQVKETSSDKKKQKQAAQKAVETKKSKKAEAKSE
jgi:hypothetical protein